MRNTANKFLKFKHMDKISRVANHTFFIIFQEGQFLHLNQFYGKATFKRPVYQNLRTNFSQKQKDDHQDHFLPTILYGQFSKYTYR